MPAADLAKAFRSPAGLWLTLAACLLQAADKPATANPILATAAVKLRTDAETRHAMDAIRRRVINVHTLITHRRMPVAGAAQLSREVNADVSRAMRARTAAHVDVKPDPMLPILQKITEGVDAIAHPTPKRGQIDGLVDVASALETYAAVFDHPGWRTLQQQ